MPLLQPPRPQRAAGTNTPVTPHHQYMQGSKQKWQTWQLSLPLFCTSSACGSPWASRLFERSQEAACPLPSGEGVPGDGGDE